MGLIEILETCSVDFISNYEENNYDAGVLFGVSESIEEIRKAKARILERLDEWAEEHQLNDPAIMYKRETEQDMINLFKQIINEEIGGE